MTISKFSRLAGALSIALGLAIAGPVLGHDTPPGGGGGGGGSSSGGSGSSGGGGGNSGGGSSTQSTATTPSIADARADIAAKSWVKAITDLKAFLHANPKSADGWNLLGFAYRNHGDLKLADTAYDRALKLNPNHVDALSYQGILYVKLGEADEAKANLAKIAKICGNTTCPQYTELAAALG